MNGQPTMVKSYELRFKSTNEVLAITISESAIRKEYLSAKDNGADISDMYVQENFISIIEWNEAMKLGLKN